MIRFEGALPSVRRMYKPLIPFGLGLCLLCLAPAQAGAQSLTNCTSNSRTQEVLSRDNYILIGQAELICEDGTEIFADEIRMFTNERRAEALGNVVFSQGRNRISANRAVFDTETRYGTFYDAVGFASVEEPEGGRLEDQPIIAGQETDVYFYGDTVARVGERRYRITNGGFTTCVQPTPRWELNAGTVVLNLGDYTFLRGVVFRVKDVPLLYVPFVYYPTKEEDRATGILLPTYGTSRSQGQIISNAFFWAINRSHDATITHEWYSKTGQGVGGEYRYNLGLGSEGILNANMSDEILVADGGFQGGTSREYRVEGNFNQRLPRNFRARGTINYFTSLTQQLISQSDITRASNGNRRIGANVVGALRTFSVNADVQYNENFHNLTDSTVTGGQPRVSITQNERPMWRNSPLYVSFGGEYARLMNEVRTSDGVEDRSLSRFDVTPRIRLPIKNWQWLTINTSAAWRDTFYTRSVDPDTIDPQTNRASIIDETLNRHYFTLQADLVGPVFNRIFDTPGSGYAERLKHTIEPFARITRVTETEDFERVVLYDSVDHIIGNTTRIEYGLENRLYAKRPLGGSVSVAQEILRVGIRQTYYTDGRQALNDRDYATGVGNQENRYSPIALDVRATPADSWNATLRAEVDSRYKELRTLSVSGNYNPSEQVRVTAGWQQRFFVENLPGFDEPRSVSRDLTANVFMQMPNSRLGGRYEINYDVRRALLRQQRVTAFYNAQCCGLALEYQTFDLSGRGAGTDSRFFISFTLAGLGSFSPLSGAMRDVPR